jgi:hypothetical protein
MKDVTMKHAVPTGSRILHQTARKSDYLDCFRLVLPLREELSVDYLMARVFSAMPWWVRGLLSLRNALVAVFGLRTDTGNMPREVARDVRFEAGSPGFVFAVIDRTDDELVMEEGDKHLDFRVSVKKSAGPAGATVCELTTVVWYNNWLGPVYFTVVKPFHRALMRAMMHRAARGLITEFGAGQEPHGAPAARVAVWLGRFGALGFVALGIMHFPLAFQLAKHPAFAQLSRPASDLLILLSLCVGLLLLLVGTLTLYFSPRLRRGDTAARVFFLTVAVALVGRTVLDVLYPLSILGETASVGQDLLFTGLGFLLPAILAGKGREAGPPPRLGYFSGESTVVCSGEVDAHPSRSSHACASAANAWADASSALASSGANVTVAS